MNDFFIGSIIGASQIIIGHPLDTIKTSIQAKIPIKQYSIRRLYKGVSFPLGGSIFFNSIMFGLYVHFVNNYTNNHFIAGGLSGALSSFVVNPVEMMKVSRQNLQDIKFNPTRGFVSTLCRETISCSIYFGIYHTLKEDYNFYPFFAGSSSGVLSWLFTYPIDVVKTRIQTNPNMNYKTAIQNKNFWKGLKICLTRASLVNGVSFYLYSLLSK